MTRQDEFKEKLFALLREYDVEMKVEEGFDGGYNVSVEGISFWSDAKYEDGEKVRDQIDFMVGCWEDGK